MDYNEIIARKKNIVERPVISIPEEAMIGIKDTLRQRCSKSIMLYEKAKNVIPAGLEHNLGLIKPFPIAIKKSMGAMITDVDGNEYIDHLLTGGPIILGNHFMPLDEKIIEYIRENGPSSGLTSEAEIMCAEEIIKHMPGVEMVRFLASGSEADSLAIRLARTYTGKKKIIKIAGSYHGWSDQLLVSTDYPRMGRLHASGIPSECLDNTIEVAPNDFEGLRKAFIENQKDGIAGILAEPTGGHAGTFPVHPDWNKTLRAICDEFGALLIFDEVVTGFRLSLGGGQEYYGITPDLTVLGKIVSHGYPSAGALGGKKEIMRFCHPGGEGHRKAYTGGTLSANPISTLAGYYAIKFIEEYQACEKAATYGNKVTGCLNQLFATRKDLSFFAYNIQSIVHVETGCPSGVYLKNMDFDHQVAEQNTRSSVGMDVYLALMTKGVMILGDCKRLYCCMQHNDQTLDQFMKAWEYVLSLFPVR